MYDARDHPLVAMLDECRIKYRGRARAEQRGGRLLVVVKADGSVQLHDPSGGVKPHYYNPSGRTSWWWRLDRLCIRSASSTGESLWVSGFPEFVEDLAPREVEPREPRRRVAGRERDLVAWIRENPGAVGLRGEPAEEIRVTGGRVDLRIGSTIVEVKKNAGVTAFDQAQRYLRDPGVGRVVIACLDASQSLEDLCSSSLRIQLVRLPSSAIRP